MDKCYYLIMEITKKSTPNYAIGRNGQKIEIIVLHISDGSLESCISWFATPTSQVSSHYLVGQKGEIIQFVSDSDNAWANGQVISPTSLYVKSRPGINPNSYSLSIENEGHDLNTAPDTQLNALGALVANLATKYGIILDRTHIIGHREIKATKPNCPSPTLSVIDRVIQIAKNVSDPIVMIPCPTSHVMVAQEFISNLDKHA